MRNPKSAVIDLSPIIYPPIEPFKYYFESYILIKLVKTLTKNQKQKNKIKIKIKSK